VEGQGIGLTRLLPFLAWRHRVDAPTLRADLVAGLIGAVLVLPQGVAYATLAGMPPEYGLYGAMLPAVVGALWGSSWHLVSGPTNATSLMVFATVGALAVPFTPAYVGLVLTLNLMVGLVKLGLGVARLGALVNFISTSVVIGFTAGAGCLIVGAQLHSFFGIAIPQHPNFIHSLTAFFARLGETDPATLSVGIVTLVAAIASARWLKRVPYMLTAIVVGAVYAWVLERMGIAHVATIGALPSAIPPLSMPEFSLRTWETLAPLALALTVIGLSEAISSARAVALRSGQRIDGNQEFIGQGLANIVGAFTSSYPTSGSFNRTGANFEAGAKTSLAGVFSAGWLVVILFVVAPLATRLPVASMAAVLFVVARGLIDVAAARHVWKTSRGDALSLAITFIATLTIRLEVAILVGVLVSLLVYLNRTTHPELTRVLPDPASPTRRLTRVTAHTRLCPQLDILRIDGSLFFGAVEHLRDELDAMRRNRHGVSHALIVCSGVNFIDAAGADLLVHESRAMRDAGVTLHLCSLKRPVREVLERGGQLAEFGHQNVHLTKADALRTIYSTLDPAICEACEVRAFLECRDVLPDGRRRGQVLPFA